VNDLDERKLDEYLALIDKKISANGGKDWSCLSNAERTTITAYFLALEVSNGGFHQFFLNPSGNRWRETLAAIKTVGAFRLEGLFEQALTVFPDSAPAEDHSTRFAQLRAAGEPAEEFLSNLTDQYYDLQAESAENCLYQRLTAFAIQQLAK
jgi:hypothetical protein